MSSPLRFDREQLQMVLALLLVAAIAAALLGLTDMVTRQPIAMAQKAALHNALQQVLPAHANDPQNEQLGFTRLGGGDGEAVQIYPARDAQGVLTGLAWELVAPDGYSGSIRILLGLRPDGHVQAIRVTEHRETPGLGDGIVRNQGWLASFVGKSLQGTIWAVRKDGGSFDQFTGATITPRAVVKAVRRGLEFYRQNQQAILAAIAGADSREQESKQGGQQ